MAAISIQAGGGRQGMFRNTARTLTCIARTVALATILVAAAGAAQAADSTDRIIPPNPADVAILRGLLALQHPALRQGAAAATAPAAVNPAVTTEPAGPKPGETQKAPTEGEARVAPASVTQTASGFAPEAAATRIARLEESFRASLDRSMAAAGFDADRL